MRSWCKKASRAARNQYKPAEGGDHRVAFDNRNADLLFQVVSRRYEKKSLVLTSNLAFADGHTVFPSATCAERQLLLPNDDN